MKERNHPDAPFTARLVPQNHRDSRPLTPPYETPDPSIGSGTAPCIGSGPGSRLGRRSDAQLPASGTYVEPNRDPNERPRILLQGSGASSSGRVRGLDPNQTLWFCGTGRAVNVWEHVLEKGVHMGSSWFIHRENRGSSSYKRNQVLESLHPGTKPFEQGFLFEISADEPFSVRNQERSSEECGMVKQSIEQVLPKVPQGGAARCG